VSEVSVDAAGLPVPGITGVDEYHLVEISGEPERGTQSCGSTADYCYIIMVFGHAGRGCKFDSCT
jgi:hypothetical protein